MTTSRRGATLGDVIGDRTRAGAAGFDREVAALLIEVFRPRMDVLAWRVDDADTAARLRDWERAARGAAGRPWTVGDWRPAGSRARRRPVTAEDVALHLAGLRTLGFYPLRADGTCASVSVDLDDHRGGRSLEADPTRDFEAIASRLEAAGVPYLAHRSRGGRGYWLHVLLPDVAPSAEARSVLRMMVSRAGVRGVAQGGSFDGIFPRQDAASPGGLGNLFCLPMSRRWLARDPPGGGFVGVDPGDFDAQVIHLWRARRVPRELWRALAEEASHVPSPARPRPRASRPAPREAGVGETAWCIALRRAGRLGRPLGDGRHALLCIRDHAHSSPDHSVENARGSCVLFPASARHPEGMPWCAHAHCADLTRDDWIAAVGRDAWDDACLAARGMRRAGPFLLHAGGVGTWYRGVDGVILPSRRELLCPVPVWIAEEREGPRGGSRVVEAVVGGRARRVTVPAGRFESLAWLARFGVPVDAMLPAARARLLEALERLSEPVPRRASGGDQLAAQARAEDFVRLLGALLPRARDAANDAETTAGDRVSTAGHAGVG